MSKNRIFFKVDNKITNVEDLNPIQFLEFMQQIGILLKQYKRSKEDDIERLTKRN